MELTKTLEKIKSYLIQGAYQGAEHVLDGAIFEAESIQSECETLRVRIGEMAAEIERLQGVIDEANAQEPVGKVRKVAHGGPHSFQVYDNLQIGESKVYARPIPAQQSPAVAVPEWLIDLRENLPEYIKSCNGYISLTPDQIEFLIRNQSGASPRITEQDAREIIEAVAHIGVNFGYGAFEIQPEMVAKCRALLNKLNGDENGK